MLQVKYSKLQKMTACLLAAVVLCLFLSRAALAADVNSVQVRSAPLQNDSITRDGMVRVYLSSLGNPSSLDLTVNGNYSLSHSGEFIPDGCRLHVAFSASTGNLTLSYNGQTYHMGQSFSLRRHSANGANGILIAQSRDSQNPYPGDLSFEVVYSGGSYTLYTIAHIYIENYLYGVLPYEMGNSSGMEALKAQAVAARTYTVRMMEKRTSGRYDVKDTTSDQVYRGTPSGNANCAAAVDATKGIVLMYGSDYITTYYSASNGGQTETNRTGSAYAYMKVKDDPFDFANPSSTVKKKTVYEDLSDASNPSVLIALLKSKAISRLQRSGYLASEENTVLKTLKNVTPHTPMYASPSRLYTKMDFTFTVSTDNASGQPSLVTLTETCDIFTELEAPLGMNIQSMQNELWSVEKGNGRFVLQARRYGHGMGMSQRGAMYMAQMGYSYDQILGFYYDGCKRVKHSFTNSILSASSTEQQITVEPPAELEQPNGKCTGMVTLVGNRASVAIRIAPLSNAKVIGSVGNGALTEVLYQEGNWVQIRFGELIGYVPAETLVVSGVPEQQPVAATDILGFAYVTANDYVNLRAGNSMSSKILGTAPTEAILTVFSKTGSWARVQYQALTAYVNTGYISSVMDHYPSSDLSTGSRKAIVITQDGTGTVNMRRSPSTTAELVDRLPAGSSLTVLDDDGSWCKVSCDAGEGYILAEFLQYISDEEQPPETDSEAPETGDETPEQDATEEHSSRISATVNTVSGSLNLRSEADTGSRVMITIPRGAQVMVMSRGDSWTAVHYAGFDGFVMTKYLSFHNGPSQPEDGSADKTENEKGSCEGYAYVDTQSGSLNLRMQPGLHSDILTTVPRNAALQVTAYGTGWCAVRYLSYEGYVMTRYLRFENQTEQQPETETEKPVEETKKMWVNTTSGSLNIRSEPDGRSRILGSVPRYSQVTMLANGTEWSSIIYEEITGYVMTRYLTYEKPSGEANDAETSLPSTEQTPEEDETKTQDPFVTIGGLVLDVTLDTPDHAMFASALQDTFVYDMCSETGGCLFVIPAGEEVEVLLTGRYWYRIAYQGQQGYCPAKQLNVR